MISTRDGGMSDRCALIVGGTSGIGLASAVALAKDGVNRLVLVGRDSQPSWARFAARKYRT